MNIATLSKGLVTLSTPQYTILDYTYNAGSNANILINIPLLGIDRSIASYLTEQSISLTGVSYAIDLNNIMIASSSSTKFAFDLLTIADSSKVNTIYDVLNSTNINLLYRNTSSKFIIRNEDNPMTNNLYLYLVNSDSGNNLNTITIQITYVNLLTKAE